MSTCSCLPRLALSHRASSFLPPLTSALRLAKESWRPSLQLGFSSLFSFVSQLFVSTSYVVKSTLGSSKQNLLVHAAYLHYSNPHLAFGALLYLSLLKILIFKSSPSRVSHAPVCLKKGGWRSLSSAPSPIWLSHKETLLNIISPGKSRQEKSS